MTRPAHARAREERTCECGCGQRLDDRRRNVRYVNRTHQQRAYRAKVKAEAEANGIPGSLSLRTVRAGRSTSNRHVDGPTRRTAPQRRRKRPSDITSTYERNVDAFTYVLIGSPLHVAPVLAVQLAERAALHALSERKRAELQRLEVAA